MSPIDSRRDAGEIERAITTFAHSPLAARYKLPTIYPFDYMVRKGGLMAYVPSIIDQSRSAATYVDRILKGEKPADLPVQQATNVELYINLKTAKALGLNGPNSLIGRADHVIE